MAPATGELQGERIWARNDDEGPSDGGQESPMFKSSDGRPEKIAAAMGQEEMQTDITGLLDELMMS